MEGKGNTNGGSNWKMTVFMALGMAFFMSLGMSLVMTSVNVGFVDRFPFIWLRSWCIGFIVALPLSFILPVIFRKAAVKLGIAGPPS